jgi:hypothetical protein
VLRYGTAGKEFQVRKTTTKISPSRLTFLYTHTQPHTKILRTAFYQRLKQ